MAIPTPDYFIDATDGLDSNNGTSESTPFKTIDPVQTLMEAGTITAGDIIGLKTGTTLAPFAVNDHWLNLGRVSGFSSGTADNPIIFRPYGNMSNAMPIVSMKQYNGKRAVIRVDGKPASNGGHHVRFEYIHFIQSNDSPMVRLSEAEGIIFFKCFFRNVVGDYGGYHPKNDSKHCWVLNCTFLGLGGESLYLSTHTDPDNCNNIRMINNAAVECGGETDVKGGTYDSLLLNHYSEHCGDYNGTATAVQIHVSADGFMMKNIVVIGELTTAGGAISIGGDRSNQPGNYGAGTHLEDFVIVGQRRTGGNNAFGLRVAGEDTNYAVNGTIIDCDDGIEMKASDTTNGDLKAVNILLMDNDTDVVYSTGSSGSPAYTVDTTTAQAADFAETDRYSPAGTATARVIQQGTASHRLFEHAGTAGSNPPDNGGHQFQFSSDAYFTDYFDSGDGSKWTGENGTVSYPTSPVHSTGYSLSMVPLNGSNRFVYLNDLAWRYVDISFWVNLDSVTASSTNTIRLMRGWKENAASTKTVAVDVEYDGANWEVRGRGWDDAASLSSTSLYTMPSGWNHIMLRQVAAFDPAQNNGTVEIWLNGALKERIKDLNNDTLTTGRLELGAIIPDAGVSGTLYIDDVRCGLREDVPWQPFLVDTDNEGAWEFATATGAGDDLSDNSRNLSKTGTPDWTGISTIGLPVGGVFTGAGEYYKTGGTFLAGTTAPLTILFSFWATAYDTTKDIFSLYDNISTGQKAIDIYVTSNRVLTCELASSTGGGSMDINISSPYILPYQQHRGALTWAAGDTLTLWLDGEEVNEISATNGTALYTATGTKEIRIGGGGIYIDDFSILSEVATDGELKHWMRYGWAGVSVAGGSQATGVLLLFSGD